MISIGNNVYDYIYLTDGEIELINLLRKNPHIKKDVLEYALSKTINQSIPENEGE